MDNNDQRWITEERLQTTHRLDQMTTSEILTVMNQEDQFVPHAVKNVLPSIADTVDAMVESILQGGRIFYMGAGTSGRLGVLDASECPPTFSSDPSTVQGIIAGGVKALQYAIEGAEDRKDQGVRDLQARDFTATDFLIGLSASGRTPYVLGALAYASHIGAKTASITCNPDSPMGQLATYAIEPNTGPEILTGSTRLKAGTAQKMVLNMLSTTLMIRLGKTYSNLMVDLKPTNKKLQNRSRQIVSLATGVSLSKAASTLERAGGEVKTAIVLLLANIDVETARQRLIRSNGRVRDALHQS
ncbi:N-acetylmuramic acid 6-phosphate etherase [Marininema halotolerans]|uniref:N-acetylmuramic acid 6-phosphate etherase n=1 Tax=Marininema halotolerans TaxID=1155944 RepID=A0A1I6P8P6_9BACL|nr:N-acetylmuramic acid 6-phosphate etherase [Marininema halotolerans]SFS36561.1 N-acetylmuramic acid 6-phosphate etherase [Marininema halotolerans]